MAHDMVDDWVGADSESDSGKPSKEEARAWFQDTLRKRGNTCYFTGEEKGQLNNYINEFGNTFFWAGSSSKSNFDIPNADLEQARHEFLGSSGASLDQLQNHNPNDPDSSIHNNPHLRKNAGGGRVIPKRHRGDFNLSLQDVLTPAEWDDYIQFGVVPDHAKDLSPLSSSAHLELVRLVGQDKAEQLKQQYLNDGGDNPTLVFDTLAQLFNDIPTDSFVDRLESEWYEELESTFPPPTLLSSASSPNSFTCPKCGEYNYNGSRCRMCGYGADDPDSDEDDDDGFLGSSGIPTDMSPSGQIKVMWAARSQAEQFFRTPFGYLKSIRFDGSEDDKAKFWRLLGSVGHYATWGDRDRDIADQWYDLLIENAMEQLGIYSSGVNSPMGDYIEGDEPEPLYPVSDPELDDYYAQNDLDENDFNSSSNLASDSDVGIAFQYVKDNNIPHNFERIYEALLNSGLFDTDIPASEDDIFDIAFLVCSELGVNVASSAKIPIQQDRKGLIAMVKNWLQRVHEGLMEKSVFYQNLMRLLKGNGYPGSKANSIYEDLMAGHPVEVVLASFKRVRSSTFDGSGYGAGFRANPNDPYNLDKGQVCPHYVDGKCSFCYEDNGLEWCNTHPMPECEGKENCHVWGFSSPVNKGFTQPTV